MTRKAATSSKKYNAREPMKTSAPVIWRSWLIAFACAAPIVVGGLCFIVNFTAGGVIPRERYFRAVFVLQSLGGPAAAEKENIPVRVPYADATESLLHHPDKIFVLGRVAEELAFLRAEEPKAALFESYARLGLGDRREAARLLAAYVVESEYNAGHYALLCRTLHELGDYSSLLLICREWFERDPSCRGDRLRLTWTALHNMERYGQAKAYMQGEGACLGWQAQVYAAKSALAAGEKHEADAALETVLERYADDAMLIHRLWDQLKDKVRV